MNAQQLAIKLLEQPRDLEVTIDVDDGMKDNYIPVKGIRLVENIYGSFIVIDADFVKR